MNKLQPTLFEALEIQPTIEPQYAQGSSLQERFAEFDRQNPHVYEALKALSLDMKRRGFARWSIKAAFEICRWMASFQTRDTEFKLNNNYHAFYARKLMAEVPALEGFFELRERKSGG